MVSSFLKGLKPQALCLNVLVCLLVVVIAFTGGSWQGVFALIATLGALCFLWTRPTDVKSVEGTQLKELDEKLEEKVKELHARIGTLSLKVGLKGV